MEQFGCVQYKKLKQIVSHFVGAQKSTQFTIGNTKNTGKLSAKHSHALIRNIRNIKTSRRKVGPNFDVL